MNRLLTDDDVKTIAGPTAIVITYDQLKHFPRLSQNDMDLIILYRHNETTGHWVAVIKHSPHLYEYFDSYGKIVDEPLSYVPSYLSKSPAKRKLGERLGQNYPWLSRLFLEFQKENKNNTVIYNEHQYQSTNGTFDSATCGRWVGFRIRHKNIPLYEFQDYWNEIKQGHDPDHVIIYNTDKYLY